MSVESPLGSFRATRSPTRFVMRALAIGEIQLTRSIFRIEIGVAANPLAHQAAKQLIDRLTGRLTDNVPASDLETADDPHQSRVGALREAARKAKPEQALDMMRILPCKVAREDIFRRPRDHLRMQPAGIDLTGALDPACRAKPHQDPVPPPEKGRRHGDDMNLAARDLHCKRPVSRPVRHRSPKARHRSPARPAPASGCP